jgi:hypothetical protein
MSRWWLWGSLVACAPAEPVDTDRSDDGSWRSALYPASWAPGFADADGRALHDFSFAGYRHGAEPPAISGPIVDAVALGADPTGTVDSTAAIQAAIDAASGGVAFLPAGLYRVDGFLEVTASSTVVRGAGPDRTRIAFTRTDGVSDRGMLTFRGSLQLGPDIPLTLDAQPFHTRVRVGSTDGLQIGQAVALGFTITPEFVEEHGMTGIWEVSNGRWRAFFRRTVVGLEPSSGTVTLDVPVRYPALRRDGASLRVETGHLTEVGLEGLALSTAVDWGEAWSSTRTHAALLVGVRDGWVRDVHSFASPLAENTRDRHLRSGGVKVLDSARVTLADLDLRLAQHRGEGGNGYLVEISRSNEVLVRDSAAVGGRHNFIQNWDFGTSGCVWLRTVSAEGRALVSSSSPVGGPGYSEFHHSLAIANLIDDSVVDDGWAAVNRRTFSSGAGHTATASVFWNLRGEGIVRSFQHGHGYVVGTDGLRVEVALDTPDLFRAPEGTAPEDWAEGVGAGADLSPRSLYEDQRARRLAR